MECSENGSDGHELWIHSDRGLHLIDGDDGGNDGIHCGSTLVDDDWRYRVLGGKGVLYGAGAGVVHFDSLVSAADLTFGAKQRVS